MNQPLMHPNPRRIAAFGREENCAKKPSKNDRSNGPGRAKVAKDCVCSHFSYIILVSDKDSKACGGCSEFE